MQTSLILATLLTAISMSGQPQQVRPSECQPRMQEADAQPIPLTTPQQANVAVGKGQPIAWDDVGRKATLDYSGDGLSVFTAGGAVRMRCNFQKLEGEATAGGLWILSTATPGAVERFRLVASGINGVALPVEGVVAMNNQRARFIRPGLTEEYSVSVDGVRQDFVVEERPTGSGELRLELALTGARASARPEGARLVMDGSGRRLAYTRLNVLDAKGKPLPARIVVTHPSPAEGIPASGAGSRLPVHPAALTVVVNDSGANYPVRIDPTFSDDNWTSMDGLPGANDAVHAAAVDDSGNLYIGGSFTAVAHIAANHVARWDGSGWSALGPGVDGTVTSLAVSGGDVYAGGSFTNAGGMTALRIARWNGTNWLALGAGLSGTVSALAISGSDLYVGGSFTNAGGIAALRIAKWDGSVWSGLGAGLNSGVRALAVSGTHLFVAGYFTTAGGITANHVARWDGTNWSALASGLNSAAYALAVSGSDLYVGGYFTSAGVAGANNVAKWDGTSWSALGTGLGSQVNALAVSGNDLYAGGMFTTAGGIGAGYAAKWDGTNWAALGAGLNGTVNALAFSGNDLYVGGVFSIAGGFAAFQVAKFDGSGWSPMGSGLNGQVTALAVSGTDLYLGGTFWTVGAITANHIAKWDGTNWSALGSGLNGDVNTLAVSGTDLYVGGSFSQAGGITSHALAKWNGTNWSALSLIRLDTVYALLFSGSNLYAGGTFKIPGPTRGTNLAKWDGTNWSPLGIRPNGPVYALAVSGSDLYAGGKFTSVGGIAATNVAKLSGTNWSALGTGTRGPVYALAASGGILYAGGAFTNTGAFPAKNVASWDGNSWSPLGTGVKGTVNALGVSGVYLYVGGTFTNAGGIAASRIARWNGSNWSALGSGVNNPVLALAMSDTAVYLGGTFTTAGGKVSAYVAKLPEGRQAPATINLTQLNQIYNGTARCASAATLPPDLAVTLTYDGTATCPTNAGTYTVVGTVNDPDYTGTVTNMLVVAKATLFAAGESRSRLYGSLNPHMIVRYTGFVNGETSSVLTTRPVAQTFATRSSPVGDYEITVTGGTAANYDVVPVSGVFTVTRAPLTVYCDNQTRFEGQENPVLTGTVTGVIPGDAITAGYTTTALKQSPAGTYPILPIFMDPEGKLGNYNVTTNAGVLTVKAAVTGGMLSVDARDIQLPGPEGGVRIRLQGTASQAYRIEVSGNLDLWDVLTRGVAGTNGVFDVRDTQSGSFPHRFYRAVSE